MRILVHVRSHDLPDRVYDRIIDILREHENTFSFNLDGQQITAGRDISFETAPGTIEYCRELKLEVPAIDTGLGLPVWMKGVPHVVELTESTASNIQNGRFRFGGARGEVNTYVIEGYGPNPSRNTTKITIHARGKFAYKQALALYGKIRSGEFVEYWRLAQAIQGKKAVLPSNIVELWD